jgi:hypothetical protein
MNPFINASCMLMMLLTLTVNIVTAQPVFDVRKFGAKGDGKTDDPKAIQRSIDACSKAGGDVVLLPSPHTFLAGPFDLKSNIEFRVAAGAILLANPDEGVYKKSAFRQNSGEGTIWIGGEDIQNVTLSGSGEINGNGISFIGKELHDSYELKPFHILDPRPHVLTITGEGIFASGIFALVTQPTGPFT